MRGFLKISFLVFLIALHISCSEDVEIEKKALFEIPVGFPEIEFPEDNEPTEARILLGKKLFNDTRLSITNNVSCATCHQANLAFTDGKQFAQGVFGRSTETNSPTLVNLAYHPYFLKEGGVPNLEQQILVPIQEHNEFNHNILEIAEQLSKDSIYVRMALNAYDREFDPFVITRSIAAYERIFLSGNSRFDKFNFQGKSNALSASEKRGLDLFNSEKLKCNQCHSGFNFTNYQFNNNGLYTSYVHEGRFRITSDTLDIAKFKTPTLRNIELTAPYMHNGSIQTLEEVLQHYASGGKNHPNKSTLITGFDLNDQEQEDVVNFLKSLTDFEFVSNSKFK